jgi:hypothetical protein
VNFFFWQEKLVEQMAELLNTDSEAFPRRAAVELLTVLCSKLSASATSDPGSSKILEKICTRMVSAMEDFDWEVKVKVLDFWENIAETLLTGKLNGDYDGKEEPDGLTEHKTKGSQAKAGTKHKLQELSEDKAYTVLQGLLDRGFGKAVLTGAEDYDLSVKQKALAILAKVAEICSAHAPSASKQLHTSTESSDIASTHKSKQKEIEDCCGKTASFLAKLAELDPSHQLKHLGSSSDEYNCKPLSLLEDVRAAAEGTKAVHQVTLLSEDEFDDADDMFVDCY